MRFLAKSVILLSALNFVLPTVRCEGVVTIVEGA